MSKEIELNITIGKNGKITVTPKGTAGKECLEIMKFLDKVAGFSTIETKANEDMKKESNNLSIQEIKTKD